MLIKILDTQVPLKHQLKDLVEYKSISAEYKNQSSKPLAWIHAGWADFTF